MGMDKYTKVKKIGEGSFGKAYLVRSKEQPGKQFVIKEINMGKMGRKEREESRKEVAVLAQLQHPNVVAYRESFEELTNLYIVMDFCDGGDLYSKISAQRGILFPEEQIMDWFVQLCLSIKHIHDRKILHRDIKSQNIFLTRSGIVKLGDFGIAKVLNSTVELARTCIGTPYYLSPEICENRPYNNKSDIWSLGCVLYELATLKHAFEAGNMKNLVLKIIRGSYPPVAPKYSYELRMLVGQLFKRNPRDRPSISTVLKKPFIQRRIQKFLSETELQSEFSHTVMHGHKIHKQLPLGPAAGRQPFAKPAPVAAAKRPISAPSKKYNPASVYGKPAVGVRKSGDKENRSSADKKKPGGGGVPAVGGVAGALNYQRNDDVNKRRQELVEREKQRKADYARQHRDLIEKQRVARMNKAREEGWKNLVSSLNSNEDDDDKKPGPRQAPSRPAPAPKPAVVDSTAAIKQPQQANVFPKPAAANDRGDYDKYHAYLDKIQAEQEQRMKAAAAAGAGDAPDPMDVDLPVARPMGGWPDKDAVKRELDRGDNDPTKFAEEARQKANAAAERAKQVEEFLNRKREAAYNRQRVKADVFGNVPPSYDGPTVQKQAKPSNIQGRNVEEQDYLARLRQIRLQNFQERRAMKARQGEGAAVSEALGDPKFDPDARRKKIEALRAQADARAKQLKEQLEKKREDVFAKQKEQWRKQQEKQAPSRAVGEQRAVGGAQRAAPQRAAPQRAAPQRAAPQRAVAAEPSPGLTNVMQAIGVTPPEKPIVNQGAVSPPPAMTNVFAAIGVDVSQKEEPKPESEASSPLQKQKKEILKKLNEKAPPARGKWGAPVQPAMEPAQESVAERPKWGGAPVNLGGMSLEETASNMEATNAADIVIKNPDERPLPVRKQWGGPAGTALNFLQGAKIIDSATMNIDGDKPSVSYLGFTYVVKPAATIVVTKPPSVAKGTIVISSQDKGEPDVDSIPEISAADDRPDSAQGLSPTKPTASPKSAWGEEKSLEKTGRKSPRPRTPKTPKSESPEIAGDKLAKSGRKSTSPRPRTPKTPKSDQRTEQDASAGRKSASPLEGEEPKAGSPQKLFERVQLDDDEDETKQEMTDLQVEEIENEDESEGETNPKLSSLHGGSAGVVIGVTTGHFDMADRSMLRTCSMPDLSKLFRTAADNLFFQEPVSVSVDVAYLDNECEDSGADEDTVAQVEEDKTGDESSDDVSDDDDDSGEADEEDMKSLRETMEKLLEASELNVPESEKPKSIKTVTSRNQKDELEGSGEVHGTIIPGKEEWESDDDEDTMFDESEEDTFCRLEESRLELEEQLGCDVFMKAYKTVQALQEDEDEAIEDGHKAVSTILGKPNEHLYQKILNLVLADGAYLEDND